MFAVSQSISSFLGCKEIEVELYIPAPVEVVWSVLTDVESYGLWNPVFQLKEGRLSVGNKISYFVKSSTGKISTIRAFVSQVDECNALHQVGGIVGITTFSHSYRLTRMGPGTVMTIFEKYTGIAVNFWNEASKVKQYEILAHALKARVGEYC